MKQHIITLCVSDWPEAHANVEFVCKAVNEHDTLIAQRNVLLEALTVILDSEQSTLVDSGSILGYDLRTMARAALEKGRVAE